MWVPYRIGGYIIYADSYHDNLECKFVCGKTRERVETPHTPTHFHTHTDMYVLRVRCQRKRKTVGNRGVGMEIDTRQTDVHATYKVYRNALESENDYF